MMSGPMPAATGSSRYHLVVDSIVTTIEGKTPERMVLEATSRRRDKSTAYMVAVYEVYGGDDTYKGNMIEHTRIKRNRPTILYYNRREDVLHRDGRPAGFWDGT